MHYWTWFGARSNILKTIYLPFAMELLLFKFTKSYYDSFWHTFTQFGYVRPSKNMFGSFIWRKNKGFLVERIHVEMMH